MSPPESFFLVKVVYSEDKKEIACQFRNGKKGKTFREKFFPFVIVSIEFKEKVLNLISKSFKKQVFVVEKNFLKVTAVSFSVLKNFCTSLGENSTYLIEPERQFLILKNWSYFDEFVFNDFKPVRLEKVSFPLIDFDETPLVDLVREMLVVSEVSARELLQNMVWSKLLKIPVSKIPVEKFVLIELFLQNIFFENAFVVPNRSEANFLPVKREKINLVKNDLCEMNFNTVWSKLFSKFNLGFDSLNCDCCKPSSITDSNLLPNSLIEVEFLVDGLFFSSFNPSFASKFHKSNSFKQARKKFQLDWGLEFVPVGPFMRGEKALIPLPDALNLFKENKLKINFSSSKFNWFCKKNSSFLVNSFNELNKLLGFVEKNLFDLKKSFLSSFGLNYEFELNKFPEFIFFNFVHGSIEFLLNSVPFQLLSPFSRFYSSSLAESIDSIQNLVLTEFKNSLINSNARIVFASPGKVLIQASAPLSVLKDFSSKSGFPSPKIVSEWNSSLV